MHTVPPSPPNPSHTRSFLRALHPRHARQHPIRYVLTSIAASIAACWLFCVFLILLFRFVNPPTTAVQTERRFEAWHHNKLYQKRSIFVPLAQINPELQHAVIAAEDARFYQHHGFDWHAIEFAAENDIDGGRLRGGSTITQQLVKNLFLGTSRSILRKAIEFTLVPVAELVLGKQRILELYLNVVELGPGIYGVEAAARTWDQTTARKITRDQAAHLAAILPAPLKRRPSRMNSYSAIILERMRQMGW